MPQELILLGSNPADEETAQRIANFLADHLCADKFTLVIRICTDPDALAHAFNIGYDAAHAGGPYVNPYQFNTSEHHFYQDGWSTYKTQQAAIHKPRRYNGASM